MADPEPEEPIIEQLQRRAMESAARELPWEELDVLADLREPAADADAAPPDLTLGGYIARHDRPPAFEGSDGQPYSVDIEIAEPAAAGAPYAAFLVFVRWADTGAGIMGHVETGDVAHGATPEEARHAALELSLYDVKAELDAAIARRRAALED